MRPDQMPRQPEDPEQEQPDVVMTNVELADAIAFAFESCGRPYICGSPSPGTEPGKVMLAHLKELTAIQARRAALFVVPPNTRA